MGPIEMHETSKMLFQCQKSNGLKSHDKNAKRNRQEEGRNADMLISTLSLSWVRHTAPRATLPIN